MTRTIYSNSKEHNTYYESDMFALCLRSTNWYQKFILLKKIKILLFFFMSYFRVKTKLSGKPRAFMPPVPQFPLLLTTYTTVIHLLQLMNLCVQLWLCNLWTVAHQAPLSMGFPRQEYWSGLPFHPPGDLPDIGIKPKSPLASSALAGRFFMTVPFGKPYVLSHSVGSDSFWSHGL